MGQFIDLSGQRFGQLVALRRVGTNKSGSAIWLCKCDCGNEKEINAGSLRYGTSLSCGCSRKRHLIDNPPKKTHGESHTRLYYVWCGMRQRCSDKHNIHVHFLCRNNYRQIRSRRRNNGNHQSTQYDSHGLGVGCRYQAWPHPVCRRNQREVLLPCKGKAGK